MKYISHKEVTAYEVEYAESGGLSYPDHWVLRLKDAPRANYYVKREVVARYMPRPGDFLVIYADGYESISPRKAFLEGYKPKSDKAEGLPVVGYRPQNSQALELVNANKVAEERILRTLDALAKNDDVDKRWLAIGRTHLEQAFMAINRAIFKPARVELPEDKA